MFICLEVIPIIISHSMKYFLLGFQGVNLHLGLRFYTCSSLFWRRNLHFFLESISILVQSNKGTIIPTGPANLCHVDTENAAFTMSSL